MARKGSRRLFTLWSRPLQPGARWEWEGQERDERTCWQLCRALQVRRKEAWGGPSWLVLPPGETPYLAPERG